MRIKAKGKLSDAGHIEVPVFQNGKIFTKGKPQIRAGFIKGKQSNYTCNTVRIEIIEDLALLLKQYGTLELHSTMYDNVRYAIHLRKKRGVRHSLNVLFRNMLQENVIIKGSLESILRLVKNGVMVEIKLTKFGTEISTKDV